MVAKSLGGKSVQYKSERMLRADRACSASCRLRFASGRFHDFVVGRSIIRGYLGAGWTNTAKRAAGRGTMKTEPDLHYRHLAEVAGDIRSGALTAEEVMRHTLERIARLEPRCMRLRSVRADDALTEARAADARKARGEALGALHGVPIAVKDLCAMAGTPTRAGGFFSTGFGARDTATVVTRLQAAGAIIIGKAQLTEGAWGTHHPDIPVPVNPWAEDRWSGSSSSGSGVSVAAGLCVWRDGHGYGRVDPLSLGVQSSGRVEADLGARQPARRVPAFRYVRSCRADGALGARRRVDVRRDGGGRSARSDVAGRAG